MKYITLIVGLLVVGCGKQEQADTNESTPTTTEKPVKELTAEEKVVGEYEMKEGGETFGGVLLENGILEWYINGEKLIEHKWSIVDVKIHIKYFTSGEIEVYRINTDKSITLIASVTDGKRKDYSKDKQTYKKIK